MSFIKYWVAYIVISSIISLGNNNLKNKQIVNDFNNKFSEESYTLKNLFNNYKNDFDIDIKKFKNSIEKYLNNIKYCKKTVVKLEKELENYKIEQLKLNKKLEDKRLIKISTKSKLDKNSKSIKEYKNNENKYISELVKFKYDMNQYLDFYNQNKIDIIRNQIDIKYSLFMAKRLKLYSTYLTYIKMELDLDYKEFKIEIPVFDYEEELRKYDNLAMIKSSVDRQNRYLIKENKLNIEEINEIKKKIEINIKKLDKNHNKIFIDLINDGIKIFDDFNIHINDFNSIQESIYNLDLQFLPQKEELKFYKIWFKIDKEMLKYTPLKIELLQLIKKQFNKRNWVLFFIITVVLLILSIVVNIYLLYVKNKNKNKNELLEVDSSLLN